jgi:hypothetical protein
METPAKRPATPSLRLVVDNTDRRVGLMPILEVERRLAAIERDLRRSGLAAARRGNLQEMQALLRRELEARPFDPALARRCEHRVRWIERSQFATESARPVTLQGRARAVLSAILPGLVASA